MGRRDDLIGRAAQTIQDQCGLTPDIELLAAVVDGCGPAIYSAAQSYHRSLIDMRRICAVGA